MGCPKVILSGAKIRRILKTLKARKYKVFTRPFELNIIGVRNSNTQYDKFDDTMYVIWKNDKNKWEGREYAITTDPSTKYLAKGGYESIKGTAILPNGQHLDKWKIRGHGKTGYEALGQFRSGEDKKLCVYRDWNRDSILTFNVKEQTCGHYGINIHRAKKGGADDGEGNTKTIGSYSAGCQVFQNYYCFLEFMDMARKHRDLYENSFTYTLIDKSLEKKFRVKRTIYATALIGGIALLSYGVYRALKSK
jgi:hypothetical protein